MTTFVLVHGAWAGAHGWRVVRKRLAADGHEVFTPSLTGIGERVHLASPQVDLTTHVNDVVNQIVFEDLRDIVLVGYSYGGVVVTAAVEHVHDRVRELVFLDAFVPSDGDSAFDALGAAGPTLIGLGDEWLVPPPARDYDDPDEAAWQRPRRVAHPLRCFTEPVHLAQPLEDYGFGLTYIKASGRATRHGEWQRVLGGGGARPGVTTLALRRDRHQPHGRQQPTCRTRSAAGRDRRHELELVAEVELAALGPLQLAATTSWAACPAARASRRAAAARTPRACGGGSRRARRRGRRREPRPRRRRDSLPL